MARSRSAAPTFLFCFIALVAFYGWFEKKLTVTLCLIPGTGLVRRFFLSPQSVVVPTQGVVGVSHAVLAIYLVFVAVYHVFRIADTLHACAFFHEAVGD